MSIIDRAVQRAFAAAARMDSVVNVMTGLGGASDKGTQVAVDTSRTPLRAEEKDVLGRYNGYVVAWFERLANEATLTGWDVKSGSDVLQQFEAFERTLKIQKAMRRASQIALKDGASLVLVVTKGAREAANLKTSLNLKTVKEITALHVFDESEFEVHEYETDYRKPNWRRAKLYQLNPVVNGTTRGNGRAGDIHTKGEVVHHTHCLYFHGRELADRLRNLNNGKDDSYLDSTWDAIKDMQQIDQGAAVLAQEMNESVVKIGGLEAIDAGSLAEVMRTRLRTIAAGKGLLGMIVIAEDDEYISRAASTTGYKDLKGGAKSTWAAQSSQPETVAFGATPGGLNTDGEAGRRFWDRIVAAFQQTHLKEPLERLYEIIVATMDDPPERWQISFRPLGTMTPMEEADVKNKNAQTDRIYRQEGILSPDHIRLSRFGEDGYQDIQPVDPEEIIPSDPSRAFDGPQGRSVLEVVLQVATKSLPRDAGVAQMIHLYNLTEEVAELIMGEVGKTFFVEQQDVQSAPKVKTPADQLAVQGARATRP